MNELVISIMSDLNPSCPYTATSINTSNLTVHILHALHQQ